MATLGNSGNLNMDYCQSSKCQSGATVYTSTSNHTAYDVFQNYGYFATHIKKSVFWDTHQTTTNFLNPIRAELDANRPVLFAGESAVILPKEAHCWVCDGYDVHGDINAFHFNFGWGGSGDGVWYYISNINPSGDDFNSGEEVILVQPDYDYIVDCNSSVNVTTNFPFSWTAGTVFNSGSFTAVTGSDLTYTAYNEVKLSNGFRAEPGSNFRATTAPCPNPNCPNPPPDFRTSNQQGNNTTASNTTGGRGSTGAVTPKATAVQSKLGTNIKLGIFPNPTSGVVYLNLSAQSAGTLLVNISDLNGNQLLHNSFDANVGANSFKVDLGSLNQGVYFINVTDENGVSIKNDKLVLMPQ